MVLLRFQDFDLIRLKIIENQNGKLDEFKKRPSFISCPISLKRNQKNR